MQYFPNLKQGDPINRKWFNDLIGFCNSLVLRGDGRTTRVDRTASGTTVSAIQQPVTAGGGGGARAPEERHAPFRMNVSNDLNILFISHGFASLNGNVVPVNGGTIHANEITSSTGDGYIMLRAPFDDSTGWGNFEYAVLEYTASMPDDIFSIDITDSDFPIGYVALNSDGKIGHYEDFTPSMAIFVKTGECDE